MIARELAALHRQCFTTPRPWHAEEFDALLDQKGIELLTAKDGFLLGRIFAGEAEILTLAVHPAHRRQGIAQALVARFLAEAESYDSDICHLEVAAGNAAAIALYERFGFVERGRRPGYYGQGAAQVDAVVMSRGLPL